MRHHKSELQSLKLHTERASKQCGLAKIGAEFLHFPPGDNPRKVKHLTRVFKLEGCDRENRRHVIPGNIKKGQLISALSYSNLTLENLKNSQTAPILRFPPGTLVQCAQGRSRLTALANVASGGDVWWLVELFVDLTALGFEALVEEFENESHPSDGHICWKIHENFRYDMVIANRWWARLSKSKANILRRLFKHDVLRQPFMLVLQIPGMRDGLQLGTLLEIMSSKMDEQVGHYLRHTYANCLFVMGSHEDLQFLDTTTVQALELCAPGQSRKDYAIISRMMENKQIFGDMRQAHKRQAILNRLSQMNGLFTTIHTLQQDCKYIRPCGRVLRALVLGENAVRAEMVHEQTVEELMASVFTPPTGTDSDIFQNNLKLLYLYVMRNLKLLSGEHCLLEANERPHSPLTRNHKCWFELAQHASALGFDSMNIRELVVSDPHLIMARNFLLSAQLEFSSLQIEKHARQLARILNRGRPKSANSESIRLTSDVGEQLQRRCGRQYTTAYNLARLHYTPSILNLRQIPEGHDITCLFVWKSRFHAFWGNDEIKSLLGADSEDTFNGNENAARRDCDLADLDIPDHITQDIVGGPTAEHDHRSSAFLNVVLNCDENQQSSTTETPNLMVNREPTLVETSELVMRDAEERCFTSSEGPEHDMPDRESAQAPYRYNDLNSERFRARKATKRGPSKLTKLSEADLVPIMTPDISHNDDGPQGRVVADNTTEIETARTSPFEPAPVGSSSDETPVKVRVYYLEVNNTWTLVGRHTKENITREVEKFLRGCENALYLWNGEGKSIWPVDCPHVDDQFVCMTSDKNGFHGIQPPEEVTL